MSTLRRVTSVALAVAFCALAASGAVMLLARGFGTRLRLHPVHEVFGIVMIVAGAIHVALNLKPLLAHLRRRAVLVVALALSALVALLVVAGFRRPLDERVLQRLQQAALELHQPRPR